MATSVACKRFARLASLPAIVMTFVVGIFGAAGLAHADAPINTLAGIAIEGYDPVAYFREGRATKGSKEFAHEWLGATWYFADAEHRDLFAADPVKYAPQYGGYCAGGMAKNHIAYIDPEVWRIVDGKLYLLHMKGELGSSEPDIAGMITKGDANWPQIKADLLAQ